MNACLNQLKVKWRKSKMVKCIACGWEVINTRKKRCACGRFWKKQEDRK